MDLQSKIKESKKRKIKLTLEEFEDLIIENIKEKRIECEESEDEYYLTLKNLKEMIKLYNNFLADRITYDLLPWYDKEDKFAGYTKKQKKHVGF